MRVALKMRKSVAKETMAFYFTKPVGFAHKAGQSVDLTLIGEPVLDSAGNSRSFSLASAPQEEDLMIACRMRETAFKNRLKELPIGSELVLDGPFGSFSLHENAKRPAVCIAGGIGITPFRSMVVDATERSLTHTITLIYSNRDESRATFLEELRSLDKRNHNFHLVPIFSGTEGRITEPFLAKHIAFAGNPIFYIAGPTAMVSATRTLLETLGASSDDIRFEEFSGY